jgi:hypothetical protein
MLLIGNDIDPIVNHSVKKVVRCVMKGNEDHFWQSWDNLKYSEKKALNSILGVELENVKPSTPAKPVRPIESPSKSPSRSNIEWDSSTHTHGSRSASTTPTPRKTGIARVELADLG